MKQILMIKNVNGMCTSKMLQLDIFKYLKPENGNASKAYLGNGQIYNKEAAKELCFQYFYNGVWGEQLALLLGNSEDKQGFIIGRTITNLGIGLKQKGVLKNCDLNEVDVKKLINDLVEFVYEEH